MTPRKPSRKVLRALCAEDSPEDGVDPRLAARSGRSPSRPGHARKARQLCRQVAETLDAVLAGERDDVLRNLRVVEVTPTPDPARLLVTVATHPPADPPIDPSAVLDRLAKASGRLRTEVAAAITRKRAPVLVYRLALSGGS